MVDVFERLDLLRIGGDAGDQPNDMDQVNSSGA